jgi:chromosome segregation ATPase
MGLGSFWNEAEKLEHELQACFHSRANHTNLTGPLARQLKEMQNTIEQQRSEIEKMKSRINKIESDVNNLLNAYRIKMTG